MVLNPCPRCRRLYQYAIFQRLIYFLVKSFQSCPLVQAARSESLIQLIALLVDISAYYARYPIGQQPPPESFPVIFTRKLLSWESLIVIDLSEFGQLLLHALKQTLLGFIMLLVMEMDVQVAGIRQVSRTFGSCNHSEF